MAMRKAMAVTLIATMLALNALLGTPAAIAMKGGARATKTLLVRLKDPEQAAVGAEVGGYSIDPDPYLAKIGWAKVHVPAGQEICAVSALSDSPDVLSVEAEGTMHATFTPNDPYYRDSSKVYAPQKISAPGAWDVTLGDPSVTIAVVDTGLDISHPEFQGRVLAGYDFVDNDSAPDDANGHGTHVAGIAAAGTNNGVGIAGICGNCSVLPVRVLDASGVGTWSQVADGIIYAADHGAKIINLSLTGKYPSNAVADAVNYAWNHGALVVAAAGNSDSSEPSYPAAYDKVVAVAATTTSDSKWGLSNYGNWITVAAPGATVYSTVPGGGYDFKSGTSMAAPHVSGLAGLIWSVNPKLTNQDVWDLITEHADDLGDPGKDEYFGWGRINAAASVHAAAATVGSTLEAVVWYDRNGDGIQQADEEPLPGVSVRLHWADGDRVYEPGGDDYLVAENTTDSTGTYSFHGLEPGHGYWVEVDPSTLPKGLAATPKLLSAPGNTQVQAPLGVAHPKGQIPMVSSSSTSEAVASVSVTKQVTLAGKVWNDLDGDGVVDPGEPGMSGCTVKIFSSDGSQVTQAVTDDNGDFTVSDLSAGTYTISADTPEGYASTTSTSETVSVAPGATKSGINFGVVVPTAVQVSSFAVNPDGGAVRVAWSTTLEEGVTSFVVQRALKSKGPWASVGEVQSAGVGGQGADYEFTDTSVKPGMAYWYRVQAQPSGEAVGPVSVSIPIGGNDSVLLFVPVVMAPW